ncbi:MAG: hypothetical protein JWO14_2946, partial [Solirubrobacterales bacterium]|nr:hypothetical protein [Solirubrobacterales bacterium]
ASPCAAIAARRACAALSSMSGAATARDTPPILADAGARRRPRRLAGPQPPASFRTSELFELTVPAVPTSGSVEVFLALVVSFTL